MLGNLNDQIVFIVINGRIRNRERIHDAGKFSLIKRNVDHRSNDLYNLSYIHTRLLQIE